MRYVRIVFSAILIVVCAVTASSGAVLVLDDPLQGSTTGTREGGVFVADGWKVTGQYDGIYWHVPTIPHGAAEFDVKGLDPDECDPGLEDKAELYHMYDYTFGNSDYNYNGGYRDNPYKMFIRKIGCLGSYNGSTNAMEIVWKIGDIYTEDDTPVLSWDANTRPLR